MRDGHNNRESNETTTVHNDAVSKDTVTFRETYQSAALYSAGFNQPSNLPHTLILSDYSHS